MKTNEEKAAFVAQLAATIYAGYAANGDANSSNVDWSVSEAIDICKRSAKAFECTFEVAE